MKRDERQRDMRGAAEVFRALGDEARLRILWLLMQRTELCVCDVMAVLGIGQSKTSRHLRYLRSAGLVSDRREGKWSYYALRRDAEPLARAHLRTLRATLAGLQESEALVRALEGWMEKKAAGKTCG